MTSAATLKALESNRRFTDLKDAEARLAQASRDLIARVISQEEYVTISDVCQKTIKSCQFK